MWPSAWQRQAEEGVDQIGGTCIIAPSGELVAERHTLVDEVVTASCGLDLAARYKHLEFASTVSVDPTKIVRKKRNVI